MSRGEAVERHVAHGGGASPASISPPAEIEVGAGDHRLDARQRLAPLGVDLHDARVRVRAALDAARQHAGQVEVGAEHGAAGDLVDAIGADRPRADDLQRLALEFWLPSLIVLVSWRSCFAASSTARTTLS